MEQTATAAALPGTTEEYMLDWQWRRTHDDIEGRSRWISHDEARSDDAESDWFGNDSEDMLIQTVGKKPDDAGQPLTCGALKRLMERGNHAHWIHVTNSERQGIKLGTDG